MIWLYSVLSVVHILTQYHKTFGKGRRVHIKHKITKASIHMLHTPLFVMTTPPLAPVPRSLRL